MWRFYFLLLGLFLLTVAGAEQEDFQSNLPEQTKGTVVTKYGLMVKTDAIVRGTEAAPTQTTHRGTEEETATKFPKTKMFDTELKPTNEGMQTTTSLVTALQSMEHIHSSNVQNTLKSSTTYLSESKVPLKSSYEKLVLSSPQAALVLNNAFETQVHLSADAVKATPWFHAPRAIGNHRNANSVIPTSADTGLLHPILSASHPRVIDNLMELFNDSDDKRPQGKSITNLGGNVDLSGTMQSILQSDPTEDLMKRNAVTDLCLTCLKDGKVMSRKEFAAQPAASPHVSSGSLSLATLSHNIHPLSAGKSKEIKDRNSTKDAIIFNHTFLPFTLNKTENQSVSFVSQIAAEMSLVTNYYTTIHPTQTYPGKALVPAKLNLTSTAQYASSKSLYTGEKPVKYGQQEVFYKKVSFREPQSKLMHFTESKKKASRSLSTNLKNQDISSEPVSNAPLSAPHSSFNSLLPKGLAHSSASHPTARMNLIEALGAITPVTLCRPTASTVKNLKSRFLTARAGAFISVLSSQTESKAASPTKQPILTLSPKGPTISLPSVTPKHFLDEQVSQTFTFEDSIVKQSPVNFQTTMNMIAMIKLQASNFGAKKVIPVRIFGSRSRLGSDNQSALTRLMSTSFTKKQKEAQSKTIQHVTVMKFNSKLFSESQNIHSLKLEERKEVFSVFAENEDKYILQTKSNHSREITETDEILTLNKEDEILENKKEILLRLDNPGIGKLGEIFNSTAETNQNTYREAVKMKEFITKTSRQEHVTLRHDKDLQHAEVKDEGDAKRDGVTKINTETSTLGAAGKQRHFLEEKGAQPGSVDNIKFNKNIWKQDLTNAPLQPATNWKELNGDKERIVEKLSSCHGLIKDLDASEHKGVHLGENASQIGDLTNKSFSFVVTSNRQLPHPSVRSQAPDLKAELPKEDITLPLKETSPQEVKGTFPATALPKLSEFIDMLKPLISPSSSAAKKANLLSLTTQFQRAQSHFIVNSSLNLLIIHGTTDHKHKFNCSVFKAEPVLHRVNEQGHAEYVTPSTHQQMYDDSSTKTPTVTALSSQPRIYLGPLQPHRGQSAAQRSHSSSCSNTTPGQLCPSRLSEQASYPDTSAVKKKQIFSQAPPTLSGIPAAGINRLPFKRASPVMKLRTFRSDRLTVTSMLQKLTRSQQINFVPRSNSSESLLGTSGEANQSKKKHDVMFMMTLNAKQSDGVTGDKQTTVRSKHVANNTDEFNSSTLQIENKTKQNDLTNAGGKDEANNIIMTPKHHHRFELEDSTQFGHVTNYVDTTDRTGTAAFSQADSLPKRPKIQLDDELYPSSVIKHGVAKTTERRNSQSLTQQSESNNSVHIANSNLSINLTLKHQISAQQRITTSQFEIKANKTTDIVSQTVTPVAIREGFNSLLTTSETLPDSKKSTQNAFEHISQPSAHTKPLTQRELPITLSSDKLTPAVQRIKIKETHIVQKQPKQRILAQAAKQGQHALLSTTALSDTINMPKSEFLKMAHRAGEGYGQTSAATEQMSDLSFKGIKSVRYLLENIYGGHSQDRVDEHKKHTLPETTSISQAVFAHMADFVPHAKIPPTEFMNKTSCTSIGCAMSSDTTKTDVIDHTEEMYKTQIPEKDNLHAQNANKTKFRNNWSFHHSLPGKPAAQAIKLKVELSPVTSKWEHDYPSDDTVSKGAKSTSDKTVHLERKDTRQWSKFATKTTQRRFQNISRAAATEAALSESGRAAVETTIKSTEYTLPAERNTTTQLDRRAGRARMLEEQNASRSPHAQAKKETAGPESGSRLLVSELQTKSELPRLNQRRRTSPHQYVSGMTEISDDLCGSGNYTAEMRLKMGRILEPGDVVPAHGNLRVIINLKTNNSQINLGVTSCCLSPILQPDVTNSTCCLFSWPAAELSGITLLPSALSTSASFTISLFQMINYSVVYLHCDLSVCLRNHSDCERQCLQRRNAFPSEDAGTVVANRISFGPMLKQANNSTFPTEIDPSELDLVLVFVSLVIGFSLISVMLLLVWLAYHRRAIWLLRSAAPSQACCSCLRPGGDLILP